MLNKQTVVFLSVLVLLVMFLFPVLLFRLAVVEGIFSGLNGKLAATGNITNETDSIRIPVALSALAPGLPDSSTASPVPQSTLAPGLLDSSTASPVAQSTLAPGLLDSSTASPVAQSTSPDSSVPAKEGLFMKRLVQAAQQ